MSDFQGSLEFKIKHHLNREIGGGGYIILQGRKLFWGKIFRALRRIERRCDGF